MTEWYSKLEPNRPVPEWDEEARRWLQQQLEIIQEELESKFSTYYSNFETVTTLTTFAVDLDAMALDAAAFELAPIVRIHAGGRFSASVATKAIILRVNGTDFAAPIISSSTDNVWRIDAEVVGDRCSGTWVTEVGAQAFTMQLVTDPVGNGLTVIINGQSSTAGHLQMDYFYVEFQRRTL